MAHASIKFPANVEEANAGETDRLLNVRLQEHRHTLKECLLEISKLAQKYAYGGHRIGWN
jgi:hypothetical protein